MAAAALAPALAWVVAPPPAACEASTQTAPVPSGAPGGRQPDDAWRIATGTWRSGCGRYECRLNGHGAELTTPYDTPTRWSLAELRRGRGRDALSRVFGEAVCRQVEAAATVGTRVETLRA